MIEDSLGGSKPRCAPYRSWNEYRIAGLLEKHSIPFIYEKPTAVMDGGLLRVWYPDLTLSYGLLIEYFGIQGNPEYDRRTSHKLRVYEENQMDVIPVYQQDMGRGWDAHLLQRIDTKLEQRLTGYRTAIRSCLLKSSLQAQTYR